MWLSFSLFANYDRRLGRQESKAMALFPYVVEYCSNMLLPNNMQRRCSLLKDVN